MANQSEQKGQQGGGKGSGRTEPEKIDALRVHAKIDGFRRAGRAWHGTTTVPRKDFTKDQVRQLEDEPRVVVEEVQVAPDEIDAD